MSKKLLIFILVFSMVASCVTGFAEGTKKSEYLFWDFEKKASEYSGLSLKANGGTSEVNDGVLKMSYNSGDAPNASVDLSKTYKAITEAAVIEFDYKSSSSKVNIYFQNAPISGSMFRMVQSDNKLVTTNAPSATATSNVNITVKSDFEKEKWYHFQFILNYGEKKVSLYLDGEKVFENFNFFYQSEYASAFSVLYFGPVGAGDVYVDNLMVYAPGDNEAIAEAYINQLNIPEIADGDINIETNLYGSIPVSWTTSDENVIALDGTVNFPTFAEGDKTITLTAEITVKGINKTKEFFVKVPARMTDNEAVTIAKENFTLENDIVYDSFSLPAEYENGVLISWTVDNDEIVVISETAVDGVYDVTINRPSQDTQVVLEATFEKGNETKTSTYNLMVIRVWTDSEYVEADKAEIILPQSVKESFELPQSGPNGSAVSWALSDTDFAEIVGTMFNIKKRDTVDKQVTLTATLTKGEATDTVEFIVIIEKDIEGNTKLLEEAVEALTLGDTSKITDDITLPLTGINETVIVWKTSDSDVITESGVITRRNRTESANLTATVTKGTLSKEKVFKITIPGKGGSSGPSGSGGGGGFGGGSSSGTVISMPTTREPDIQAETVPVSEFLDVSVEHWAFDYIKNLSSKKIISGMGDGLFVPAGEITREAFVKMLVTAMHGENIPETENSFADIEGNEWFAKYVAFANEKGYVMGIDENNFGTGSLITREQMAVIIARCLDLKASDAPSCTDEAEISDYAKDAVAALGEKKIMNGDDTGSFNPKNHATRAETAKVIYELIKFLGKDK